MSAQQIRWACSLLPWHLGAAPPSHRLLLSSCSERVSPWAAKRALSFHISFTSWPSPWDAQFFCKNIVILVHQELSNFIVLIIPSSYDLSNAREMARTSVCFFISYPSVPQWKSYKLLCRREWGLSCPVITSGEGLPESRPVSEDLHKLIQS